MLAFGHTYVSPCAQQIQDDYVIDFQQKINICTFWALKHVLDKSNAHVQIRVCSVIQNCTFKTKSLENRPMMEIHNIIGFKPAGLDTSNNLMGFVMQGTMTRAPLVSN